MRIWYDTEFRENGSTIDLISIGMVAEDGREYYAINAEADWRTIYQDQWLMDNVVSSLPRIDAGLIDYGHPDVKARVTIRNEVAEFLRPQPIDMYQPADLWAWYGAYDHVALAQLFGRMIDLPRHIPMWTNDLRQEVERLGNPRLPAQAEGLHNALADARFLKVRAEYLSTVYPP